MFFFLGSRTESALLFAKPNEDSGLGQFALSSPPLSIFCPKIEKEADLAVDCFKPKWAVDEVPAGSLEHSDSDIQQGYGSQDISENLIPTESLFKPESEHSSLNSWRKILPRHIQTIPQVKFSFAFTDAVQYSTVIVVV